VGGSLFRIYRDVRFSKDKSPYKTWVGIRFWEGGGKAGGNPGFFFGFDATGGGLHVGMHGFDKEMLAAYRQAVDDDELGIGTRISATRCPWGRSVWAQRRALQARAPRL